MSYYSEPDSHIKDKSKEVLEMSNYTTKNNQMMLQTMINLI